MSPPGEETVYEANSSEDAEDRGNNGTGNPDSEHSTLSERVQRVLGLVLIIVGNDHATGS